MAKKLSHIKGMPRSYLKSFRQFYLLYSKISQILFDQSRYDKIKIFKLPFEKEGFRASKIEVIRGKQ